MKFTLVLGSKRLDADVRVEKGNAVVEVSGKTLALENVERLSPHEFSFTLNGKTVKAFAAAPTRRVGAERHLFVDGRTLYYRAETAGAHHAAQHHHHDMTAPMPGKILKVFVKEGDAVKRGQPVLILEAMKMEHGIQAAFDGVVKRLLVKEGDRVELGAALCDVEENGSES
jgi:biotin carboxyl carrier protein